MVENIIVCEEKLFYFTQLYIPIVNANIVSDNSDEDVYDINEELSSPCCYLKQITEIEELKEEKESVNPKIEFKINKW